MKPSVPSENIVKLRELTNKLCDLPNDNYKNSIKEIKSIVDEVETEIVTKKTPQAKIKCYIVMYETIKTLLGNIKEL